MTLNFEMECGCFVWVRKKNVIRKVWQSTYIMYMYASCPEPSTELQDNTFFFMHDKIFLVTLYLQRIQLNKMLVLLCFIAAFFLNGLSRVDCLEIQGN